MSDDPSDEAYWPSWSSVPFKELHPGGAAPGLCSCKPLPDYICSLHGMPKDNPDGESGVGKR